MLSPRSCPSLSEKEREVLDCARLQPVDAANKPKPGHQPELLFQGWQFAQVFDGCFEDVVAVLPIKLELIQERLNESQCSSANHHTRISRGVALGEMSTKRWPLRCPVQCSPLHLHLSYRVTPLGIRTRGTRVS